MKQDIYKQVTDKIIADLEQGELTWLKPETWTGGLSGRYVTTVCPTAESTC